MSIRFAAGAGLTCCLVVASSFWANAQVEKVQVERRRSEVGRTTTVRRSSIVIGATVSGRGDFSIGKVEDLVINEDGCIDYLVVASEDKFVLVPWGSATVDFERRTVVAEIERDKFRDVPTFTRERWPDVTDKVYVEKIRIAYGVRPGRERRIERRDDRKRP
jgi:PRC-barrel domain